MGSIILTAQVYWNPATQDLAENKKIIVFGFDFSTPILSPHTTLTLPGLPFLECCLVFFFSCRLFRQLIPAGLGSLRFSSFECNGHFCSTICMLQVHQLWFPQRITCKFRKHWLAFWQCKMDDPIQYTLENDFLLPIK